MIKKIFTVILTVLIISSTALVGFAEENSINAVQLSETNVVEYPVVSGEIYYTQKVGEVLSLVGGKVTADGTDSGTVIPGHFEFINPDYMPLPDLGLWASIKFVPDDTALYTGFDIEMCDKVVFDVNKAAMEFVDPTAVPTATDVVAGKRLNTSDITGIAVKCQLTGEVLTSAKWSWTKSSTKVNESGYYSAKVVCSGYETINVYIYVRTQGDTSEPTISEFPTIQSVTYREGLTAADLTIIGGSTTIPGTFAVADPAQELKGGSNVVGVVFTPDDENESTINISMVVNVEKIASTFVDEEGNAIVPEVRVGIGYELTFNSLKNLVERLTANCGKFTIQSFSNISYDTSSVSEYENAKARITTSNSNYSNELSFKLIVEPREVSPYFIAYGNDEYEITTGNYQTKPKGTYDLYVNGELVMEDIAYQTRFTWRPEKSDIYTLKAVYNPIENDTFKVNDAMRVDMVLNLVWDINCVNSKANPCAYSDKAIVLHELGDKFAGWVVYDQNGNEFTPKNMVADTSTSSLTFTMPDFPVTVKALTTEDVTGEDNSDTSLLGWFQKLIKWIIDIVSHILNFWN